MALLDAEPLDLAVVIGGYNSSNTCNLARMCADRVPTFHIADPELPRVGRRDSPSADRRARPRRTSTELVTPGLAARPGPSSSG